MYIMNRGGALKDDVAKLLKADEGSLTVFELYHFEWKVVARPTEDLLREVYYLACLIVSFSSSVTVSLCVSGHHEAASRCSLKNAHRSYVPSRHQG